MTLTYTLVGLLFLFFSADDTSVVSEPGTTATSTVVPAEKPDLAKALVNAEPAPEDKDLNRLTMAALKKSKDGDNVTAAAWNLTSLKLYPENPILYFNLGNCYFKLITDYKEALPLAKDSYAKALALRPDFWEAGLNLAVVQQKMGDLESARKTFTELLIHNPKNNTIRINLAIIDLKNEQLQDALDLLAPAGKDPLAACLSAVVLTRMHRYEDARQAWLRSLQLDPHGPYAALAKDRLQKLEKGETANLTELESNLFFGTEAGKK